VKYDPNGTILWADTLTQGYEANSIAVDSENSVFITGIGLTGDYLTVKYDSMGTIVWMDTLNNGSGDWAYGIAVDALDNIIVTGASTIGGNADYYTVKYALDTGIEEDAKDNGYSLTFDVHPNPFRERLSINFQSPNSESQTSIAIYDVSGSLVKSFHLTPDALRTTQITWDGQNETGEQLPSGVYFLKFQAGTRTAATKLLLIR
jgi:hypothetical protein